MTESLARAHRVLHVVASPRDDSRSRAVADAYLAALRAHDPTVMIDELDLWEAELPEMRGDVLGAKYALLARRAHDPAQVAAWRQVEGAIERFLAHDRYVFSVPMWNLGIPYRLKHWIDVITQPGSTFSWSPERGYEGLVHGRAALVVYASSFHYAGDSPLRPLDQQKGYMETWLRFLGIEAVETIDCGPTRPASEGHAEAQAAALVAAQALAIR